MMVKAGASGQDRGLWATLRVAAQPTCEATLRSRKGAGAWAAAMGEKGYEQHLHPEEELGGRGPDSWSPCISSTVERGHCWWQGLLVRGCF